VPFTVSVRPDEAQYGVEANAVVEAESEVMAEGTIKNEMEGLVVFALNAGEATETFADPSAAMSTAGTVALSCVGLTYVVGRAVVRLAAFVHCTAEHGRKLVPTTLSGKPAVPAVALTCEMDVIVGTASDDAAEIVKEAGAELTPELDTVIDAVPAEAMSEAEIVAVSCVALTKDVTRAEPFQSTTEPFTKFAPFTVRINPEGVHDAVVLSTVEAEDDSEEIEGAAIVNEMDVGDAPPPGPLVDTRTLAVPAVRKSAGGTVAVNCVALTLVVSNVVGVELPGLIHCTTEHGRMFVPVTVNVCAGLPAEADVCDSVLIPGAGSAAGVVSVKGNPLDTPTEFVTETTGDPGNAASAAEIVAVNCVGVALLKVVGCATPFQFTTASLVKFVPFTVSVKPCVLQYGVEAAEVVDADREVIDGGVPGGGITVNKTALEIAVVVVLPIVVAD
jgi:hypothetical protein